MPDTPLHPPIQTTAGFSYFRRSDGIYIFRFADNRRETADAWAAVLLALEADAARANEHMRVVYLMPGMWLTPYIIQTVIRTARQGSDDIRSSTAIVADGLGLGLMQPILRQLPAQALQARQIFATEEAALKWLDERLALLENHPIAP